MSRPKFRRTLGMETLEAREVMSAGGPSAQAQYMLELLNEARMKPAAAAQRVTTNLDADTTSTLSFYNVNLDQVRREIASSAPRPPLAWNAQLAAAAQAHSQDQVNTGVQSHTGSDGSTLDVRLDRAGYGNRTNAAESAYAYASSVDNAMQAFLIDWGVPSKGHRNNILQPDANSDSSFREVGIGLAVSNQLGFGPNVVTQNFGRQAGSKADLVGVAYNDQDHNHFYTPGEGVSNVHIDALNLQTGQDQSVDSWDSGGYQLALDPGQYKVTARVGSQVAQSRNVSIGSDNVKLDFVLSDPWDQSAPPANPPVRVAAPAVATPPPTPVVVQIPVTPTSPPAVTQVVEAPPTVVTTPPQVASPVKVEAQTVVDAPAPVASTPAPAPAPSATFDSSWMSGIVDWSAWNAATGRPTPI